MDKLIKSISLPKYMVEVREINGRFMVTSLYRINGFKHSTVWDDFNLASYMFDLELTEMEGH